MTSLQKIIKYGAIAFGMYLCVMIVGASIFAITAIFGITAGVEMFENNNNQAIVTKWEQEYSNITSLNINLAVCKLSIQKGDTLKVDVSDVSEQFVCKVEKNELEVKDDKLNRNFLNMGNVTPQVTIYVPERMTFNKVDIKTGVNDTNIEFLNVDKLDLEMGVGKYKMEDVLAKSAEIKAGAGEARIENSEIEELKLKGGMGELVFTGKITKTADVDCGIGKVALRLFGLPSDYRVKAHTGLGSFKVDGQKVLDNQIMGNGMVDVKVDAGIGETTIDFVED